MYSNLESILPKIQEIVEFDVDEWNIKQFQTLVNNTSRELLDVTKLDDEYSLDQDYAIWKHASNNHLKIARGKNRRTIISKDPFSSFETCIQGIKLEYSLLSNKIKLLQKLDFPNKEFTWWSELQWFIDEHFTDIRDITWDINDHIQLYANNHDLYATLEEFGINYRKYGEWWSIHLTTEDTYMRLMLKNKKKHTPDWMRWGVWLNEVRSYFPEDRSFEYDYSNDECITILRLPIIIQ